MKFVLFHGIFGGAADNWFPFLQKGLEASGATVIIPAFPYTTHEELVKVGPTFEVEQNLESWMSYCEKNLKDLQNTDKLSFVGHSVGCLFILHLLSRCDLILDSAFFVAPFLRQLNGQWYFDHVNKTFYKSDFDFIQLRKRILESFVFYSDNDPAVPTNLTLEFAQKLDSKKILVPGAGHFSTRSGFTEFPLLLELCKSRISRKVRT